MSVVDISALPDEPHLLLDTHIWLAVASGRVDKIHPELPDLIEEAAHGRRLWVSAASVWELSIKVEQRLLHIGNPYTWVSNQNRPPGVGIHGIGADIAIDVTQLPEWINPATQSEHRDPIDRFIAATARRHNLALVTAAPVMLSYAQAGHIQAVNAAPNAAVEETVAATITT